MICSCGNKRDFLINNLCEECRADPAKAKKERKKGKRSRCWGLFIVRLPTGEYLNANRTKSSVDRVLAYVYRSGTNAGKAAERTGGVVETL